LPHTTATNFQNINKSISSHLSTNADKMSLNRNVKIPRMSKDSIKNRNKLK